MRYQKKGRLIAKLICAILFYGSLIGMVSAQDYNVLANFNAIDGGNADSPLLQAFDGNFYGTTPADGSHSNSQICPNGCGTIIRLTPEGILTTIHEFCSETNCTDGAIPQSGLLQASDGNFYGTTGGGGTHDNSAYCAAGCGTLFQITPSGKYTVIYDFCAALDCLDGGVPGGLIQASNGYLYGVTATGGNFNHADCIAGCGTIFQVSPSGKLTTLYRFCPYADLCADGWDPSTALVQTSDGTLYGTTFYGGISSYCSDEMIGCGTVFSLSPSGDFTTLYTFCSQPLCLDGEKPGRLMRGSRGAVFGVTPFGGAFRSGTVYKIDATGKHTILYSFCQQQSCADGSWPEGITEGTDGNFYGSARIGGNSQGSALCMNFGCGTIFSLTPGGQLTTLYTFCPATDCLDGAYPMPLIQATNGSFYGLGSKGGTDYRGCVAGGGCGNAFSISVGLSQFVTPSPLSGTTGRIINILGNNLTGTTSVAFNGTKAEFKVISDTYLKTRVPAGASTGIIKVTTPAGALKSNVPFFVP